MEVKTQTTVVTIAKVHEEEASDTQFTESSFIFRCRHNEATRLKVLSLVLLTVQNATMVLFLRYSRTRTVEQMYLPTTTVVMGEALKFTVCLFVIFIQEGASLWKFANHINENIVQQPKDCLKMGVPSLVFVIQNNLLYVAVSNLDAATYQVSYQLKIFTTAIFSVLMLRKALSGMQWFSFVILFTGVALVQFQRDSSTKIESSDESPLLGMVAILISCIMSGFASVYFEMVLKSTKQSLWIRNVQLGLYGMIFGTFTAYTKDGAVIRSAGFFQGYDTVVFIVVVLCSLGGLSVAIVVKYADNILKSFATSAAILLSSVASIYLFDFMPSPLFVLGGFLVMLAVYIYGTYPATPTRVSPIEQKV